jgi:hypothetical protein
MIKRGNQPLFTPAPKEPCTSSVSFSKWKANLLPILLTASSSARTYLLKLDGEFDGAALDPVYILAASFGYALPN